MPPPTASELDMVLDKSWRVHAMFDLSNRTFPLEPLALSDNVRGSSAPPPSVLDLDKVLDSERLGPRLLRAMPPPPPRPDRSVADGPARSVLAEKRVSCDLRWGPVDDPARRMPSYSIRVKIDVAFSQQKVHIMRFATRSHGGPPNAGCRSTASGSGLSSVRQPKARH